MYITRSRFGISFSTVCWLLPDTRIFTCARVNQRRQFDIASATLPRFSRLHKAHTQGDLIEEKVVRVRIPAIVAEVRVPSKRIVKGAVVSQGRPINPVLSTSTVSKDRHLDLFLL